VSVRATRAVRRAVSLRRAPFLCVVAVTACGIDAVGSAPSPDGSDGGIETDGGSSATDGALADDGSTSTDGPPPDASDGPLDVQSGDAGPDVVVVGPSFCQEPSLSACYRFENAIVDESTPAVGAPTTATGVTYAAGPPGHGNALRVQSNTVIHLPDDPSWDATNVTVEFWVNIQTLPASGSRGGIFDNQRNYAVFIMPNGVARCGTANLDSTVLPLETWIHVACVWNATPDSVTVYVNGSQTGTLVSSNMPLSSTSIAAIGSNLPSGEHLDGMIDGLRIFSSVRSPAQIAAAARAGL
jgi:hypothetical protein